MKKLSLLSISELLKVRDNIDEELLNGVWQQLAEMKEGDVKSINGQNILCKPQTPPYKHTCHQCIMLHDSACIYHGMDMADLPCPVDCVFVDASTTLGGD